MKWVLYVVIAALVAACGDDLHSTTESDSRATVTPTMQQFLTNCSGVTITHLMSQMVAYSSCMGYVRGIADGHQFTVEIVHLAMPTQDAARIRLWCIPPNMTNEQVMNSVDKWISANPTDYTRITAQFSGITAATAVIVKALASDPQFSPKKC